MNCPYSRILKVAALIAGLAVSQGCGSGDSSGPTGVSGWGAAGTLDSLSGTISDSASVVDGTGNVTVVWQQNDGSVDSIYASRFDVTGGGWSAPEPLESENGGDGFNVHAAANASGVVLAVWVQNTGLQLNLDYSRYIPGTGWSTADHIAAPITSTGHPRVGIDANGDGFAIWTSGISETPNIYASRFTGSSGTWAGSVTIDSENLSTNEPIAGAVKFLSNGDAVAVWQQFDNTWQNVWANTYSALGSSWGTAEKLEQQTLGAGRPDAAVAADDSVLAWWPQAAIYTNRYTGTWSGELDLRTDTVNGGDLPSVAVAPNGDAMAAWRQTNGSTNDIKTRHYSASGDSWGSVIPADTDDILSMTEPSVAVDGSGNFVVAWRENATPGNVWVSSYEAGTGAWSSPLGLDTVDGAALTPTVLADDAGRITVVWRQEGDTAGVYDLWAVRYE